MTRIDEALIQKAMHAAEFYATAHKAPDPKAIANEVLTAVADDLRAEGWTECASTFTDLIGKTFRGELGGKHAVTNPYREDSRADL